MKRYAIIGSRGFTDYELLKSTIQTRGINDIGEIVSGGARGADSLAEQYAIDNNIKLTVFYADLETYGRKAGHIRNQSIIDHCDVVLAFWDGISRGTADSIKKAQKQNKSVILINYKAINPISLGSY